MGRIAMGGMAEIFLAHQQGLGGFERLVVLKRILPHLESDPRFVEMFLEEARTAARLNHPNIVDVLDVQRDDDALQIVMEYIAGIDLRDLLARVRRGEAHVPIAIAVRIIADAAGGLHYAHTLHGPGGSALGIVHRDVTPSNIMLTFNGVTKVLDFGIAKAGSNTRSPASTAGSLRGHLAYACPEQLRDEPLTPRSDIFSLGILLYELLTGAPLFAADSNPGLVQAVMTREVPVPSSINPEIPRALDIITLAALQRDPARRPSSAAVLRDALQDHLEQANTAISQARLSRWLRSSFEDLYLKKNSEERRTIRQARSSEIPLRGSSSLSVSESVSSTDDMDKTRVSISVVSSSVSDLTSETPMVESTADGRAIVEPLAQPANNVWLYAAAASVATLAILTALLVAYTVGRNAG